MSRKELKKNAKSVLKANYLKCILVIFIVGLFLNAGYNYTSKNFSKESSEENAFVTDKKTTYDTMEKFFNDLKINIRMKSDSKKTKGIAAPIVNKLTEGKSPIIYLLNFIDLVFFKKNISAAMISLIVTIIVIINYFFIQNLISIGECRFFLETRRYCKTKIDRILFPYKSKKISHLAYIMFLRELYLALWSITIIGGIIKRYEYSMIPYILSENPKISKKNAFHLSKELMRGHKFELFKIDISMIGWYLLDVVTLGFSNLLYTDAYNKCIYAEFYMNVRKEKIEKYKDLLIDSKLDISEVKNEEYPLLENKKTAKNKKIDYDKNYSFTTYILFFFTFAFIGWLYEVTLHLITDGTFVNRGTTYGPWLPIYGFGVVLILFLLKPFRNNYKKFLIFTILLAGVIEYSTAWYLETFMGMKWWDYSGYFLNIQGRVCFEGLLVFGLGGCAFTYFVAPLLDDLYSKIVPKVRIVICILLSLCFGVDFIYSTFYPNSGEGITDYANK